MGRLASFVRRIIQLEIRMKRKSSSCDGETNQKRRRITPKKSRTKKEPLPSHTTLPPNSIWCDGGCTDNGFPEAKGGFGVVSSSFAYSWPLPGVLQTNNRAELMALFVALLAAPENEASTIYSDSTYAMKAVKKITNGNTNLDLVHACQAMLAHRPLVTIQWVKGHSTNVGNQIADKLATQGIAEKKKEL